MSDIASPAEVVRALITGVAAGLFADIQKLYAAETHVTHPFIAGSRPLRTRDDVREHFVDAAEDADTPAGPGRPPPGVDMWIVPNLNPDGAFAGTRGNAHGVDRNRNLPWRWRRLDGVFYSGARPLSELESRIVYRLISRLRPTISIVFHQHLNLVDASGGSIAVERRFADLTGLRLARLKREPGSVATWENHRFQRTAFVVELPAGRLSSAAAARFASAIVTVSRRRSLAGAAADRLHTR